MGGELDCAVLAVSSTGTVMGLARGLRERLPGVRIVAVDAAGSVVFGGRPGPRELPGLGASRVPELLVADEVDEVVHVSDLESIAGCRALVRSEAIFAGASSGAVIAAIGKLLERVDPPFRLVTLLPDRGERYLDTVYDDAWVERLRRRAESDGAAVPALDRR